MNVEGVEYAVASVTAYSKVGTLAPKSSRVCRHSHMPITSQARD